MAEEEGDKKENKEEKTWRGGWRETRIKQSKEM